MKQNYSIETVENGYVATFQSDLARKPETSVFLKFKDLEDFVISRLRWACKPEVEPNSVDHLAGVPAAVQYQHPH